MGLWPKLFFLGDIDSLGPLELCVGGVMKLSPQLARLTFPCNVFSKLNQSSQVLRLVVQLRLLTLAGPASYQFCQAFRQTR
jgi:hypothetical protein